MVEIEEWRDIVGYEGVYCVSNFGRIKRLPIRLRMANQSTEWFRETSELIFRPSKDSKGYFQVSLGIGKKRTARVHRLVAEAFLTPPSEEIIAECQKVGISQVLVNHIDTNIENNFASNLEWCTPKYNCDYCVLTGNHNPVRGEDNYHAKLSESDVLEIYKLASIGQISQEEIAKIYGVKQITVSNIKMGRSWAWLTGQQRVARTRSKIRSKSIAQQ